MIPGERNRFAVDAGHVEENLSPAGGRGQRREYGLRRRAIVGRTGFAPGCVAWRTNAASTYGAEPRPEATAGPPLSGG